MQQSCTVGPLRDENNRISYIYITVQDVTEIAAYEQKLINLNTRDGLTGIFNRRYLETKLEEEFDRHIRYNRPLSLIMLDIDHFKKVNDTYGHQAGDHILRSLASLIDERIRTVDVVARYGGEEFCCLLPETTAESALALAEFLRMGVEAEIFHFKDKSIKITISQGVSDLSDGMDSAEMLLKRADDGLYEAKRRGRNKVAKLPNSPKPKDQ
jgi:diguanylate cyclase (GGDEF)-like protein